MWPANVGPQILTRKFWPANIDPQILARKSWPAKMWPANVGPQKCGPQMLARKCWPANIDPQILARSPHSSHSPTDFNTATSPSPIIMIIVHPSSGLSFYVDGSLKLMWVETDG